MTTRLIALALVLSLPASPLLAQSTATTQTTRRNSDMYWSGLALAGIGGGILGWGVGSPSQSVSCGGYYTITCQQAGVNKIAWIGVGGGMMAAGWAMAAIGGKKITVTPMYHGVRIGTTITLRR